MAAPCLRIVHLSRAWPADAPRAPAPVAVYPLFPHTADM